jgi:regulator of replication initiation timing
MTDEPGMTYEALMAENADLRERLAYWQDQNERNKKAGDDNYTNGQAWKKQAEGLASTIDKALNERTLAQVEAAELRGYIRRVNELDPKHARRNQVNATGKSMSQRDIERMMR